MDLEMGFYGLLIGLALVYVSLRIGSKLGNKFYDVAEQHFKKRFEKK